MIEGTVRDIVEVILLPLGYLSMMIRASIDWLMQWPYVVQAISWIDYLLEWPLVIYTLCVSVLFTLAFSFIQIRSFFTAWRMIFAHDKAKNRGDMTPLQAFINTLSSNLGNGSIVGAATAVFMGGPGAGVWVIIFGFLLMAVRFAEVFASTLWGAKAPHGTVLGGPMLYLKDVIGGRILSFLYAACCFWFGLVVGNAMQTHSICWSLNTTWGINPLVIAVVVTLFIGYVVGGGAQRIIKVSDRIVPVKVIVFFIASALVIGYHIHALVPALRLMIAAAFDPNACAGGLVGFTLMQAMSAGLNLSITATESGLGTAAILFGYTGSKDPLRSGLMGMISTLISSIVCFLVSLCIVMSGVWDSGLQSAALTIAAFSTVFGVWGGWIVSFLSLSFGVGVLVTFAYITRAAWLALTKGRYEFVFAIMYCVAAFLGAVVDVKVVWKAIQVTNGLLLSINLFGLLWLMPRLIREFRKIPKV